MQDARSLKNLKNLGSWRAWRDEGYQRSGFLAIVGWVFPSMTIAVVFAAALYGRGRGDVGVPAVLAGAGVYLAAVLGAMAFAMLRLNAWKRAHPWTPPS